MLSILTYQSVSCNLAVSLKKISTLYIPYQSKHQFSHRGTGVDWKDQIFICKFVLLNNFFHRGLYHFPSHLLILSRKLSMPYMDSLLFSSFLNLFHFPYKTNFLDQLYQLVFLPKNSKIQTLFSLFDIFSKKQLWELMLISW